MRRHVILIVFAVGFLIMSCGPSEGPAPAEPEVEALDEIVRNDTAMDAIVPAGAKIEKLAGGFAFTEGPIWMPDGYLLFSDIPANVIRKWTPSGEVSVFLENAGYDKDDANEGAFIGSNGLTLDSEGRLVLCEHGSGRMTRIEADGSRTVLADTWDGKRLNSPNDAVFRSDGTLYFTDPPYGFPRPEMQELDFMGVYRIKDGTLELLNDELTRPNGLAFSPDEKILYVANSDEEKKIWMRYDVTADGKIENGSVFYDVTAETADGAPDGMKVDQNGNVYGTGPGGVWIFSPEGKHLGSINPPEVPANLHWGDADGKTLYMTARTGLYRIKLGIAGIRP
jgi:gluconolactonase